MDKCFNSLSQIQGNTILGSNGKSDLLGITKSSSRVVVLFSIPISNRWKFSSPFSPTFDVVSFIVYVFLIDVQSCLVVILIVFPSDIKCWTFFHMLTCFLLIFLVRYLLGCFFIFKTELFFSYCCMSCLYISGWQFFIRYLCVMQMFFSYLDLASHSFDTVFCWAELVICVWNYYSYSHFFINASIFSFSLPIYFECVCILISTVDFCT